MASSSIQDGVIVNPRSGQLEAPGPQRIAKPTAASPANRPSRRPSGRSEDRGRKPDPSSASLPEKGCGARDCKWLNPPHLLHARTDRLNPPRDQDAPCPSESRRCPCLADAWESRTLMPQIGIVAPAATSRLRPPAARVTQDLRSESSAGDPHLGNARERRDSPLEEGPPPRPTRASVGGIRSRWNWRSHVGEFDRNRCPTKNETRMLRDWTNSWPTPGVGSFPSRRTVTACERTEV